MNRGFRVVLAVAAAYFGAAVLSNQLRAPPIYSSSLWLPAGVALIAVLWYDRRGIVGVLLGTLAWNLSKLVGAGIVQWVWVLSSTFISLGSTLAACVGAWATRRLGLWPVAPVGWRLIVATAVVAMLTGGIAAGIGTGTLWAGQVLHAGQGKDTLLTWLYGDVAGVLLLLPFSYWPRSASAEVRRRYFNNFVLPLVAAVSIALYALVQLVQADRQQQTARLSTEAKHLQVELEGGVHRAVALMHSLVAYMESDQAEVSRDEFDRFARGLQQIGTTVQVLQWAPRIETAQDLDAYRQLLVREGLPSLRLHPFPGVSGWVAQPIMVPTTYIVPVEGNRVVLGLDMWSEPNRRHALEAASATGQVVATAPVKLVQRPDAGSAYLFAYALRPRHSGVLQQGYVQGVFTMEQLTVSAVEQTRERGLHWVLHDVERPDQPLLEEGEPAVAGASALADQVRRFTVAGRTWQIRVQATPVFISGTQSLNLWAAQLGAVLVASAWGLLLFAQWSQTQQLTQLSGELQLRNTELRASQQQFERVAEASPTAIFQAGRGGALRYGNPALRLLSGEGAAQILVHPDDRQEYERTVQEALASAASYHLLCRFITTLQGERWVLVYANPVLDAAGQFDGHIGTMVDITPIKRSELALQRLNKAPTEDRGSFLHYVTRTLAELFDCEVAFVSEFCDGAGDRCRTLSYWVQGQFMPRREYPLARTPCAEIDQHDVIVITDEARRRYPLDPVLAEHQARAFAAAVLRESSGRPVGYVGLIRTRPLTGPDTAAILHLFRLRIAAEWERWRHEGEQKALLASLEARVVERTTALREAAEKADQANRAKSDFLATMSHEIRTPMNSALGLLELVLRQSLGHEQREMLESVQDASRSLLRLIDDLLDLSQIEAGALRLEPEAVGVPGLLKRLESLYQQTAEQKGLRLSMDIPTGLADAYVVDRLRLRQILANLIANAIKFTDHGSIVVQLRCLAHTPERDTLEFRVIDTGIGVSPEHLAQLFQPFSRVPGDASRTRGGSGLGLSISRRLAERMGGSLTMTSTPGKGSILCLTLPLSPTVGRVEDVVTLPRMASPKGAVDPMRPAILAVEDHAPSRLLIARQLRDLGYPYWLAEDGEAGWALWQLHRPPIVITDCNMPRLDGYGLALRIRAAEQAQGSVPTRIIACTADLAGSAERLAARPDHGIDELLDKPLPLARLSQVLMAAEWLVTAPPVPASAFQKNRRAAVLACLSDLSGDRASAEDLLEEFIRSFKPDCEAIANSVRAGDADACLTILHRLKGAMAALGDAELLACVTALHALARHGSLAEIGQKLPELHLLLNSLSSGPST